MPGDSVTVSVAEASDPSVKEACWVGGKQGSRAQDLCTCMILLYT